jgi:hypothetical protein
MQESRAPQRAARPRSRDGGAETLTPDERAAIEQGRWFQALPADLRESIIGRAYVWRLADGEQAVAAFGPVDHFLGVASGELVGFTPSLETGQKAASLVATPGVWLSNYSPLCEVPQRGIEFSASGVTCLLAVSRADLMDLCGRRPELTRTLLDVSALNLRFVQLLLQEFQTCTLEQKQLRWLNSAVHFNPSTAVAGNRVYRSLVSQAARPPRACRAKAGTPAWPGSRLQA